MTHDDRLGPDGRPHCPLCGEPLLFEVLDDERFLVAWSCVTCGLIRTTEPA
ncbi:hypothetical protein ACIPVB_11095 [Microbacterium sp. NPDC090007]|uniref:hypothetical protein n=1 Tax=Microbacterium sp. NPDC090007 TaxID=3364204 RepID=UPI003817AB7B